MYGTHSAIYAHNRNKTNIDFVICRMETRNRNIANNPSLGVSCSHLHPDVNPCSTQLITERSVIANRGQSATDGKQISNKRVPLTDISDHVLNTLSQVTPKRQRKLSELTKADAVTTGCANHNPFWNSSCTSMSRDLWHCTADTMVSWPWSTSGRSSDKLIQNSWFSAKQMVHILPQQPIPSTTVLLLT